MQTDLKTDNKSVEATACVFGSDLMQKKQKRLSKRYGILRALLLVLIGGILGLQLYKWNAATMARDVLPMPFGWGSAVIMSGSMEPVLSVDDMVVIHEQDSYETGDIVVYQNSRATLVIHRIVDINGEVYILQGDSNNAPDEPITKDMIKGKMVLAIPNIGAFVRAVKGSAGTIILIFLAFYLAEYLWNKQKRIEQEKVATIKAEIELLRQDVQPVDDRDVSETEEANGS